MTRRFVETTRWDVSWFMELPPEIKLLWLYLWEKCDVAGVWSVNERLASVHLGVTPDWKLALNLFEGRIQPIQGGKKWHIVEFIRAQNPGGLSRDAKPHKQIIGLVEEHGICLDPSYFMIKDGGGGDANKGFPNPLQTVHTIPYHLHPLSVGKGSAEGKPSIHTLLAQFGLPSGTKALDEWKGGINRVAKCKSIEEAKAFLSWAITQCKHQGETVEHFRHVRVLAAEWNNGQRENNWQQPLKSKEEK